MKQHRSYAEFQCRKCNTVCPAGSAFYWARGFKRSAPSSFMTCATCAGMGDPADRMALPPAPPCPPEREAVLTEHPCMGALRLALSLDMFPLLLGPPGAAKTYCAMAVLQERGYSIPDTLSVLSLSPMSGKSELMGFMDAQGRTVATGFRRMFERGGAIVIDELHNASPGALVAIHSAMEQRVAGFPDGAVQAANGFTLVATANCLRPGPGHEYAVPIDAATLDRFLLIRVGYDERYERGVALKLNPKAGRWCDAFFAARARMKNQKGLDLSPRALYRGARILSVLPLTTLEDLSRMVIQDGD